MLLKVDGLVITDKLGAILIFEADFNFQHNSYFGISWTKGVESSGVLPQKEHGGRSVHTSIEVAVIRSLFFDYVIQKRRKYVPV